MKFHKEICIHGAAALAKRRKDLVWQFREFVFLNIWFALICLVKNSIIILLEHMNLEGDKGVLWDRY